MNIKDLKPGMTVWYVNTTPPDYDSPHPGRCLELWKGTVQSVDVKTFSVKCKWDRVGGDANWVCPEYSWHRSKDIHGKVYEQLDNPHVFHTASEAIRAYLHNLVTEPKKKLMADAAKLTAGKKSDGKLTYWEAADLLLSGKAKYAYWATKHFDEDAIYRIRSTPQRNIVADLFQPTWSSDRRWYRTGEGLRKYQQRVSSWTLKPPKTSPWKNYPWLGDQDQETINHG